MGNTVKLKEIIYKGENSSNTGELNTKDVYTKVNPSTNALGKYQFVESKWGEDIKNFALKRGYKYNGTKDFLNNSILQEDFMDYYLKNTITKYVKQIRKDNEFANNLTDEQLVASIHYAGYGNTSNALKSKDFNSSLYGGISINKYLEKSGLEPISIKHPISTKKAFLKEKNQIEYKPKPYITKQDNTKVSYRVPLTFN